MTAADILLWVTGIATILSAIYAALTFHKLKGASVANVRAREAYIRQLKRGLFAIGALVVSAWLAFGFNYYDHHFREADLNDEFIVDMGLVPPFTYFATVNSKKIQERASSHRLLLVVRVSFVNVDKLADRRIEKSEAYAITGQNVALGLVSTGTMRLNPSQINPVEWNVLLLPVSVAPAQIRSIGEILALNGRLLISRTVSIMGGPPDAAPKQ